MSNERVNEIVNSLTAFSKESYYRGEMLQELLKLQSEIVDLTFNEDHAAKADLKIWDVEAHLEQQNEKAGHIGDEELDRFKAGSKELCNLIKAEISGNRGENKAFYALENVRAPHLILRNIELADQEAATEIDLLVLTPHGISIIEVKNTSRDIFISENGTYYRTGEFLKQECNIAEKMSLRERMVKRVLENAGITNVPIQSILVFTDSRIVVHNKCSGIRICFLCQLQYAVDQFDREQAKGKEVWDMELIDKTIMEARKSEAYPSEFNVTQYKYYFAVLMAKLEEAGAGQENQIEIEKAEKADTEAEDRDAGSQNKHKKYIMYAGMAINAVILAALTAVSVSVIKKYR